MTDTSRSSVLQFSLWNCLVFITFLSVACIALKYAGPLWWSILSSISLLLFMAVAVLAFVGHAEQRVFAIGFTVCVIIYGALMVVTGKQGLLTPAFQPWLPTANLLLSIYQAVENGTYVDGSTGETLPNYQPPAGGTGGGEVAAMGGFGGGTGGMGGGFGGGSSVYYRPSPPIEAFMRIGHLLLLDAFGFAGGLFACFVNRRNKRLASPVVQAAPH